MCDRLGGRKSLGVFRPVKEARKRFYFYLNAVGIRKRLLSIIFFFEYS